MNPGGIRAYLDKHAEPDAATALALEGAWSHAVCIPACAEDASFFDTLQSLQETKGGSETVVVLVVNAAVDSSPAIHRTNEAFLALLRERCDLSAAPIALGHWKDLAVMLVDRASPERRLPAREGVGLARKIAADIALALINRGSIASPWILCTDADVQLPTDYLSALPPPDAPLAAALFPFAHVPEGESGLQQAMVLYETYLHYYVLGLASAGSPYAYHTIGSLLALHAPHYAAVRGFPKRQAGEDFYLLHKLVKVAPVLPMRSGRIRIRGRRSDRVPFGTGAALQKIQGGQVCGETYTVYDPRVFTGLGAWLSALATFAENPEAAPIARVLEETNPLGSLLVDALTSLGALEAAEKARHHTRPGAALYRRLVEWNDGFRTLRLVHTLRDQGLSSLPLDQALREASFVPPHAGDTPADLLSRLRERVESAAGVPRGPSTPPRIKRT